jgi:hypothetical protein
MRESLVSHIRQFEDEGFKDIADVLRKYLEKGSWDECHAIVMMLR